MVYCYFGASWLRVLQFKSVGSNPVNKLRSLIEGSSKVREGSYDESDPRANSPNTIHTEVRGGVWLVVGVGVGIADGPTG